MNAKDIPSTNLCVWLDDWLITAAFTEIDKLSGKLPGHPQIVLGRLSKPCQQSISPVF